ncbi:MAG: hypothetical protein ACTSRI_20160 [Promethearchaeota archaeon]
MLVWGLEQNLSDWDLKIAFIKRKMKVISFDNRGVGKSSRPNYH